MTDKIKSERREEVELALKVFALATTISPFFSVTYHYGFFFRLTEDPFQTFEYHLTMSDYIKTSMTMWSPMKFIFILMLPVICMRIMKIKSACAEKRKSWIRGLGGLGVIFGAVSGVLFVYSQTLLSVASFLASFLLVWIWIVDAAYEYTPVYSLSSDKLRIFLTLAPVLFPLYFLFGALDADNSIQTNNCYHITTKDSNRMTANVYRTFEKWILVHKIRNGQTKLSWIPSDQVARISEGCKRSMM